MSRSLHFAYFAHSLRSDWNNGNAHFLRGLLRALGELGHVVTVFEPRESWSIANLRREPNAEDALRQFADVYPDLRVHPYDESRVADTALWESLLADSDIVILHEWNPPQLAQTLLEVRARSRFRLLFHDTHHRASSSPEQMRAFRIEHFDGVLAFGERLRSLYRERFGVSQVWTLHEAADTTVFRPMPDAAKTTDVLWIGNWGDEERSQEITEFLLCPAMRLPQRRFLIHGVRYPEEAMNALRGAGVQYGGYLANLDAPAAYASTRLTVHIPRRQYATTMTGIPTIRVFEALACGVPLISAPWEDAEGLFRKDDFLPVRTGEEMREALASLLDDPEGARAFAARGRETVLRRHTCHHRAQELTAIVEEVLS